MTNECSSLREFGNCRLDIKKKLLWTDGRPVQLPLRAVELLCTLVEGRGSVLTKEEIWHNVWNDAFVEETNITHTVYLLRKALAQLGEDGLIETVPRRGYRFSGTVYEIPDEEFVLHRHALTTTTIEFQETKDTSAANTQDTARAEPIHRVDRSKLAVAVAAVTCVVLLTAAVWNYRLNASGSAPSPVRSLAVLPFREIGSGDSTKHRGLGLADALITRLSSIRSVIVRPTSSVAQFESSQNDSVQLGKKLQVDAVIEGAYYRTDKAVRITMRLIDIRDEKAIWSGEFEKPAVDELALDKEICLKVADVLAPELTSKSRDALSRDLTSNSDAYQLYLEGRYEWNKRTWQGMTDADQLFRAAIAKDPNFALAYVGLADRLATTSDISEATAAIQKALDIDPNLAEAHASLGFILTFHEWKWKDAESEFRTAIDLNPGYATAHHWYAILLEIEGRNIEAEGEFRRALEIDPLSYNILGDLGQAYYFSRQFDKAKEYCDRALEINADFPFAHNYLSDIYAQTGNFDAAIEERVKAEKGSDLFDDLSATEIEKRQRSYTAMLERYKSLGYQKFITESAPVDPAKPLSFAWASRAHAFLGAKKQALSDLENAYRVRDPFIMPFIKVDPVYDSLRHEPRFQEIVKKMGLAD